MRKTGQRGTQRTNRRPISGYELVANPELAMFAESLNLMNRDADLHRSCAESFYVI